MKSWKNLFSKNLAWLSTIVLFLIALYLLNALIPSIATFLSWATDILSPFLLAVVFYYLLRPLVRFLGLKMPLYAAISIGYLVLFAAIGIVIGFVYPAVTKQINTIQSTSITENLSLLKFFNYEFELPKEIKDSLASAFSDLNTLLISWITNFISSLTKFVMALVISPFILFYLLKDDHMMYRKVVGLTPEKASVYTKGVFRDVDDALIHFVNSRILIAAFTAALALVAFLVIGLNFAFVLSLIAFIFYFIPTLGAFIALILPVFVGFSMSELMGFEVLGLMLIINTIEGFVITPLVMGQQLFMHPLTIILVLLIGGSLFGIFGLLIATPVYLVIKILIEHGIQEFKKKEKESEA